MAPRKKFSRQNIIIAAFELAEKDGLDAITIRKVAQQLGSSIAPIYVNFADVEELIQEVVNHTLEIAKQLIIKQNSGQPFRDIGIASVQFATQYSALYRDLIMKDSPYVQHEEKNTAFVIDQMRNDPTLERFSDEELKTILFKLEIYQTGLAVRAANNLLPDDVTEDDVIRMLDDIASDVVTAARLKKQNELK